MKYDTISFEKECQLFIVYGCVLLSSLFFFLFQNGYATPEYISDYTRVDLGALLRMQM